VVQTLTMPSLRIKLLVVLLFIIGFTETLSATEHSGRGPSNRYVRRFNICMSFLAHLAAAHRGDLRASATAAEAVDEIRKFRQNTFGTKKPSSSLKSGAAQNGVLHPLSRFWAAKRLQGIEAFFRGEGESSTERARYTVAQVIRGEKDILAWMDMMNGQIAEAENIYHQWASERGVIRQHWINLIFFLGFPAASLLKNLHDTGSLFRDPEISIPLTLMAIGFFGGLSHLDMTLSVLFQRTFDWYRLTKSIESKLKGVRSGKPAWMLVGRNYQPFDEVSQRIFLSGQLSPHDVSYMNFFDYSSFKMRTDARFVPGIQKLGMKSPLDRSRSWIGLDFLFSAQPAADGNLEPQLIVVLRGSRKRPVLPAPATDNQRSGVLRWVPQFIPTGR